MRCVGVSPHHAILVVCHFILPFNDIVIMTWSIIGVAITTCNQVSWSQHIPSDPFSEPLNLIGSYMCATKSGTMLHNYNLAQSLD